MFLFIEAPSGPWLYLSKNFVKTFFSQFKPSCCCCQHPIIGSFNASLKELIIGLSIFVLNIIFQVRNWRKWTSIRNSLDWVKQSFNAFLSRINDLVLCSQHVQHFSPTWAKVEKLRHGGSDRNAAHVIKGWKIQPTHHNKDSIWDAKTG